VTTPELRERADRRFEAALAGSGARDPREYYRARLREIRDDRPEAYRKAVEYYETRLVPSVADEGTEPVGAWLEYGSFLASLVAPGRTVQIDETGRAQEFDRSSAPGKLVLHLATSTREPVRLVGIPERLSPAQRATYQLLVKGSPA
jgi:hypothetical protein